MGSREMTIVNQRGDTIQEFVYDIVDTPDPATLWEIVRLLMERMNIEAVRTNATKSGHYEIEIRERGY